MDPSDRVSDAFAASHPTRPAPRTSRGRAQHSTAQHTSAQYEYQTVSTSIITLQPSLSTLHSLSSHLTRVIRYTHHSFIHPSDCLTCPSYTDPSAGFSISLSLTPSHPRTPHKPRDRLRPLSPVATLRLRRLRTRSSTPVAPSHHIPILAPSHSPVRPTSLSPTSRRVALGRSLDNRQNIRSKTPKAHLAPRSWCRALQTSPQQLLQSRGSSSSLQPRRIPRS